MEKKGVFKMRKANTSRRFSSKVGGRAAKVLIGAASVMVLLSISGQIASAESMLALDSEMRMEALSEVAEMSGDSSQDAVTTDQPWDSMSPGDDPSSTPGGGDPEGSDSSTIPGDGQFIQLKKGMTMHCTVPRYRTVALTLGKRCLFIMTGGLF